MSLFAINQATNTAKGGGLPFYTSRDYIFSDLSKGFNDTLGLWKVPANKVPTFQFWLEQDTFSSIRYIESLGNGQVTGTTFTPAITFTPVAVEDDGVDKWIYQSEDVGTLITAAPIGRWFIEFRVTLAGLPTFYYSEEFVTCVL